MLPIDDRLLKSGALPRLMGGRDRETGRVLFPCPLDDAQFEPIELPGKGTLWSWTVQRFRPKSPPYRGPAEFEPYAVGYVELDGVVIVEARLVNVDFSALSIGQNMELTTFPFMMESKECVREVYAFQPATAGTA